jgi:hypothetical protein
MLTSSTSGPRAWATSRCAVGDYTTEWAADTVALCEMYGRVFGEISEHDFRVVTVSFPIRH